MVSLFHHHHDRPSYNLTLSHTPSRAEMLLRGEWGLSFVRRVPPPPMTNDNDHDHKMTPPKYESTLASSTALHYCRKEWRHGVCVLAGCFGLKRHEHSAVSLKDIQGWPRVCFTLSTRRHSSLHHWEKGLHCWLHQKWISSLYVSFVKRVPLETLLFLRIRPWMTLFSVLSVSRKRSRYFPCWTSFKSCFPSV